ncbi:Putative Rieske 2Fe-2S iron-sulfur [Gossypium arboreum]|uniref:Putative Rieske 2Fe-2S iron-sulfur n=1 Tax=Gossypium arboreum TaxID=29729 RepID=A0A0B0PBK9_GOSAR|nr:Putative Rieske 2Fe-2S iron-sulfur [Gossypium arboreum]
MTSAFCPMFGAIEYPVVFQMVQREIYGLYRNERTYDHVCRQSSSWIIPLRRRS